MQKFNENSFFTIISCHTEEEVQKAKELQANAITYSPIFFKELKGEPKGIKNLTEIVNKYQEINFDIFCFGWNNNNKTSKRSDENSSKRLCIY